MLFLLMLTSPIWSSGLSTQEPNLANHDISFGVASIVSPKASFSQYREFGRFIADHSGLDIGFVLSDNYHKMNTKIQNGEIHIASICSGAVFELPANQVFYWLIPKIEGLKTYQSYVIVPKESPVHTFAQMKGGVFVFTETLSNSGTLYPKYYMINQGYNTSNFFKKTFYSKSHDKSIYLIQNNLADGAAVNSIVYDFLKKHRPDQIADTRIIHKSPPYCSPPIILTSALSRNEADTINTIILSMHEHTRGKEILKALGIDSFHNIDIQAFEVFKTMRQLVDANSKKNTP